ncbi:E1 ubiquitin-activating protein UBA2 KNAG_0C04650 [Huiozyma naganishii CBS 8797]|uniref:Ubiquitin-activating enzyme E1-like n=1 Tax=Huiozyma naganishii (strain ATCC MYA-139 / BCRC 22969 / CBS 8797 / KCTC 17520 / NBRC 10181 / NCYC 3082 / Yp74L-3) TaxID=1071383 RepID=J7RX05_HUIN7|nr:hypothetical protein KNAG_0C04650 [Kazachstania naganishii CBS 8797]CCK69567.1 hypothetical protein KNAG_0C04650 [Kazachstania naganishii CBS 8797]
MPRETNIVKILGQKNYEKIRNTKCLLVGAGGIGSELLKDLILMDFGEIHIVDLDTIDLSNLNRQFLFRQRDIKKPKSTTAVNAVKHFSNSKIVPYQGNIMDSTQFPLHWFEQFDIIFNALDNLAARRYVNKISQFILTPLLESGTAGFDGYIQPIIPGKTECFDCTKKETPKTFPVCTIRSTPSQPIHCIVWAKNFLFSQLFAAENTGDNMDDPNKDWGTTDPEEIKRIKQETNELQELQNIITAKQKERIPAILKKLFIQDIEKLLLLGNLWKTRDKPVPINALDIVKSPEDEKLDLNNIWPIQQQIQNFINVTEKLIDRMPKENNFIEFDKDDEDTLEFVAAASNIRSQIFNIPMKSVFDIKQIAGNIIPAIATTNALVAGLSSITSLRILNLLKYAPLKDAKDLNMAFTAKSSNMSQNRYLSNPKLAPPNCKCPVCAAVVRGVLHVSKKSLETFTLQKFVECLQSQYEYEEDISLLDMTGQRLLVDFDFDDLLQKTLSELKLHDGSVILLSDDSDRDDGMLKKPAEFYIVVSGSLNEEKMELPKLNIPLLPAPPSTTDTEETSENVDTVATTEGGQEDVITILDDTDTTSSKKRHFSDDDEGPPTKAVKQAIDDDIIELN